MSGYFNSANGAENGSKGHQAKKEKSPKQAYNQAIRLQRLILNDAEDPGLKPLYRAGLARAWCELEECKRKLKMKPLPGSLRPTDSRPKRKAKEQVSFSPVQEPNPQPVAGDNQDQK